MRTGITLAMIFGVVFIGPFGCCCGGAADKHVADRLHDNPGKSGLLVHIYGKIPIDEAQERRYLLHSSHGDFTSFEGHVVTASSIRSNLEWRIRQDPASDITFDITLGERTNFSEVADDLRWVRGLFSKTEFRGRVVVNFMSPDVLKVTSDIDY